ncbi:MAG: ribosomal RNA small subunit methyltransferase A [Planctomyces sp.]|nr:ribosomal RNA small subunit methyltransferase A [Planctomyces sp.]
MTELPRQTRSYLMSLFERHGLHPRHDLGQNFLIDLNLHDLILSEADLTEQDVVLEVGTGTGALTSGMAAEAGFVVSVEYDARVQELAREILDSAPNVRLLQCDALKNKNRINPLVLDAVREALAAEPGRRLKLVANLPYNVATPVISNLVASDLPWTRMVVTIQLELADRMAAAPGSRDFSALSVWLQSQTSVTLVRRLSPAVFWPRPQVDSAIVRIDPAPDLAAQIDDRAFLQTFVRDIFTQRRKRLRGVAASLFAHELQGRSIDDVFAAADIPLDARAEQLSPGQLVQLANSLKRPRSTGDAGADSKDAPA